MNSARYTEIVRAFRSRRIVVIGDLMMDEYLWGRATRISPESPVMVVEVDRESSVPGGAANVVNNLLALGARVSVAGVVGDDDAGRALLTDLERRGADVRGILVTADRPTTRKTRVVAHHQQVLRVDREQTHPISEAAALQLAHIVRQEVAGSHAAIVSDYNKGVLTEAVARAAVMAAREAGVCLAANAKPANVRKLAGAGALTMNVEEAVAASGSRAFHDPDALHAAGAALVRELDVDTLVVTQGSRGLTVWDRAGRSHFIPAHEVEVYDVAGAGDTVVSTLTLGLAAGADLLEAAEVANHAASCVVRHLGVATVTPDELIRDWQAEERAVRRGGGR